MCVWVCVCVCACMGMCVHVCMFSTKINLFFFFLISKTTFLLAVLHEKVSTQCRLYYIKVGCKGVKII